MKKTGKQKGYVLAIVMILCVVMTITAVSTFTIVTRYMIHSMENAQELNGTKDKDYKDNKPGFPPKKSDTSSIDDYFFDLEEIC